MMVSDQKKLANAVGGKTARACDKCIKKRARWYCTADDAFLCQSCDGSVHSANHLARRHERVRLKIASIKPSKGRGNLEISVPSWHRGITKKSRTPRQGSKNAKLSSKFQEISSVPEICSDENSHEENNEQLLYRVPIFDPFVGEFCTTSANSNEVVTHGVDESTAMIQYLPSELELAEFAADVESLLGKGLDDESFDMEGLGLLYDHSSKEKKLNENSSSCGKIKVEDEGEKMEVVMMIGNNNTNNQNQNQVDIGEINLARETFELNFDYDSPMMPCEEEEIKVQINQRDENEDCKLVMNNTSRKTLLNLDYESVISAWDDQKSPWANGERPELDSNDSWPDCMGVCGTVHPYGEGSMMMYGHNSILDRGREARVLRYREKRRTRLFSKKIRYEVRKLNAEKRPRMKGRFVKRANFSGNAFPLQK